MPVKKLTKEEYEALLQNQEESKTDTSKTLTYNENMQMLVYLGRSEKFAREMIAAVENVVENKKKMEDPDYTGEIKTI